MKSFRHRILLATILSACAANAYAVPNGWDGGADEDTDFSNVNNWVGNVLPENTGITATFGSYGGTTYTELNNDLSWTDNNLYFTSGYTISGNAFGGESTGFYIAVEDESSVTLNNNLSMEGTSIGTDLYINIEEGSALTVNGIISGNGSNLYIGTNDPSYGMVTLNGINTYTGITSVEYNSILTIGGDAEHNTASINSDVTLTGTGVEGDIPRLFGSGTIDGNVINNGGTVAAGSLDDVTGTLTITGDYTQNSQGFTLVNITKTGASMLNVLGTATLNNILQIDYQGSNYNAGNSVYHVLTAENVVYGEEFGVLAEETPSHIDGGSYYTLADPTDDGIDIYIIQEGEADNQQFFTGLTNTALNNAQHNSSLILNRLTDIHANEGSYYSASIQPFQVAYNANDLSGVVPKGEVKSGAWMKVLGSAGNMDSDGGLDGYDSRTAGIIVGIDRPVGDGALAGITAGYSATSIDGDNGSADATINTPRIGLYGSMNMGNVNFDATVGYAKSEIDADRQTILGTASSSHDQDEYSAALQASRLYAYGAYNVLPRLGAQYAHIQSDAYSETGLLAADVYKDSLDSLQPFMGASVSRNWQTSRALLVPELRATYRYEALDTERSTRLYTAGANGLANGIAAARNTLSFGAGIGASIDKSLSAYANYDADLYLSKGYEQTLSLGMKYKF